MAQFCRIRKYQGLILSLCLVGVLCLLDTQRHYKTLTSSLLTPRQNNCLKFLANRIIIELLLQCVEWYVILFYTCSLGKKYLIQPRKCVHISKYFPAWPRSRSAVGEILFRRGNFRLIWIERFVDENKHYGGISLELFIRIGGIFFLIWTTPYKRVLEMFLPHILFMIFWEKYFSCYMLLTDQISLSDYLNLLRYYVICAL